MAAASNPQPLCWWVLATRQEDKEIDSEGGEEDREEEDRCRLQVPRANANASRLRR